MTTKKRWRTNPAAFITEVLRNPEDGQQFSLYAEQRTFLKHAFSFTAEGRMQYTELCFSAGKKSGKTAFAAMIVIYTAVVLAGSGGEISLLANDLEQSSSRVFKAVVDILRASPLLCHSVDITNTKITFKSTGTTITALANDYEGFSGGNPTLCVYDELAYYASESSRRLWDEGVPSPARKISFRLSVSTAGFDGEPTPLRDVHDRAMDKGEEIAPDLRVHENLLCYWTHEMRAPWQSAAWVAEMRRTLRPSQFARLILNQWTASEATFIELEQWDAITDATMMPLLADPKLSVWAGLDLGLKHDATAIVLSGWDGKRIRVVNHQVFVPHSGQTLDIESTAEAAMLSFRGRFSLQGVYFDPWQGLGLAQRLQRAGINMIEYPQHLSNLSLMAGNLLDLIKNRQLVSYQSDELRTAISKTVAIESSRGWRLGKAVKSHRVDLTIALAMSLIACVQNAGADMAHFFELLENHQRSKAPEPEPNEYREDPLGWKEYGRSQAPQRTRVCRHCQREIIDGQPFNNVPGGYFTGEVWYAHSKCTMRAMAGLTPD
jgi:phage terminase large subunit-like protein